MKKTEFSIVKKLNLNSYSETEKNRFFETLGRLIEDLRSQIPYDANDDETWGSYFYNGGLIKCNENKMKAKEILLSTLHYIMSNKEHLDYPIHVELRNRSTLFNTQTENIGYWNPIVPFAFYGGSDELLFNELKTVFNETEYFYIGEEDSFNYKSSINGDKARCFCVYFKKKLTNKEQLISKIKSFFK